MGWGSSCVSVTPGGQTEGSSFTSFGLADDPYLVTLFSVGTIRQIWSVTGPGHPKLVSKKMTETRGLLCAVTVPSLSPRVRVGARQPNGPSPQQP